MPCQKTRYLRFLGSVLSNHSTSVEKFQQNKALGEYLIGTKSRVLVEASPNDRVWGIGLAASDKAATNPRRWRGLNLLGFALMEARAQLSASR